jgi:hypothetical protein
MLIIYILRLINKKQASLSLMRFLRNLVITRTFGSHYRDIFYNENQKILNLFQNSEISLKSRYFIKICETNFTKNSRFLQS